ncbi:MAG TPA: OmpH family outer membrane protein [Tepidisphaeraceae bacterium]|jgi:Skp family chaperone for outer membrane proteins|nr:OmpH family outer membrane protein [Tepidisphaeraceae bacterium]
MRSCRLIPLLFLAVATTALSGGFAHADSAVTGTTKVAIVNPSRVFAEIRETKSLRDKLEMKRKQLSAEEMEKRAAIENMIKDRDANYNPKHPKYQEICAQIDTAKADFQAWGMKTKAQVEREQKMMVKNLYDKIEAATGQVAQQKGIDLVIADGRQDIPNLEDVPSEDLRRLLNTRAVVYSTKSVDLTETVIAVLDQQFAAGGGGAAPAPGPGVPPAIPGPAH